MFTGNIIKLRGLSLAPAKGTKKGGSATVTFTALPAASANNGPIGAQVKQSNDFSDVGTNPDANGFINPALPTLRVKNCTAKISGTIFLDANQDGTRAGDLETTIDNFKVYVYKQTGSSPAFTYDLVNSGGTGTANGVYEVTATINNTYLVCEGPESSSWAQTKAPPIAPSSEDPTPCATNGNERSGYLITTLTQDEPGKNFGNVPAVAAQCNTSLNGTIVGTTGTFEYEARLTGDVINCKSGDLVMFTYQQGQTRVATLSPPGPDAGTKFPVVERIKWTNVSTGQNPITIKYDDVYPYDGTNVAGASDLRTMLMCTSDPRPNPGTAPFALGSNPDNVLTGDHTSCMIVSTESAGGTYEAYVYSKVDGYRSTG
jgi:hypothetical protein